jgi:hypothetical protein
MWGKIKSWFRKDRIVSCVTAQLPYLPEPLKLKHGPLLATIETWSDGTVVASIPALALYEEGDSDILALDGLAEEIGEFAVGTKVLNDHEVLGGPLLLQWRGLLEMVDISGLDNPRKGESA